MSWTGKGTWHRPRKVSHEKMQENWERVFGFKNLQDKHEREAEKVSGGVRESARNPEL